MTDATLTSAATQEVMQRLHAALQDRSDDAAIAAITDLGQLVYTSPDAKDCFLSCSAALDAVASLLSSDTAVSLAVPALWLVRCVCSGFQPNVQATVANAGVCERVAPLLASEDDRVKVEACLVLYHTCLGCKDNQAKLLNAGAMRLIVHLLDDCNVSIKHSAIKALAALTSGCNLQSQNEFAAVDGAMERLMEQLFSNDMAYVKDAVWAVGCLVDGQHKANQSSFSGMKDEGVGVRRLVDVLATTSWPDLILVILWTISLLCSCYTQRQHEISTIEGGMEIFVQLLVDAKAVNIRQQAAFAIAQVCSGSCLPNQNRVADVYGAMPRLVAMTKSEVWLIRRNALFAIANACEGHSANQLALIDIDAAVTVIVDLLSDGNHDVRRAASGAIAVLLVHPLAKEQFSAIEGGVRLLVDLLHVPSLESKVNACRSFVALCSCDSQHALAFRNLVGAHGRAMDLLIGLLHEDQHMMIRRHAASTIGSVCSNCHRNNQLQFFTEPNGVKALASCIRASDNELQRNATWALGVVCDRAGIDVSSQVFQAVPEIHLVLAEGLGTSATDVEALLHTCWVISIMCKQGGKDVQTRFYDAPKLTDSVVQLMGHAKWQLVRNALAAIASLCEDGHTMNQTAFGESVGVVDHLIELLQHEKPIIRSHTAWVIASLTENEHVANQTKITATATGSVLHILVDMLCDDVHVLRQRAALAIGRLIANHLDNVELFLSTHGGLDRLLSGIKDKHAAVRQATALSLGVVCRRQHPVAQDRLALQQSAMDDIAICLADDDEQVRQNAAWLVGCACDQHTRNQQLFGQAQQVFTSLTRLLSASSRQVRHNAVWSIHHLCKDNASNCAKFLGCVDAWMLLQNLLEDEDEEICQLADGLSSMLNPDAVGSCDGNNNDGNDGCGNENAANAGVNESSDAYTDTEHASRSDTL